jgi:L,D-transpeptidase YcbB
MTSAGKFRVWRQSLVGFASLAALALPAAAVAAGGLDVGIVYADPGLARPASGGGGARAANPLHDALSDGLRRYRERWGSLPQVDIPAGPALRAGAAGARVRALRERLGLAADGNFDSALVEALRAWQAAHTLPVDGIAGGRTIASLNRGAAYYEGLIALNIERARALPADLGRRFVLVDAADARLWMYEDGRPVDSMRVIVGKPESQTPMMASLIRYAVLNPYWNVPDDLVRTRIAPNVLRDGLSYLQERGYEILSGWAEDAPRIDPVDWAAVAAGRERLRVRQRPGDGNMMGEIKFRMPNELGIYLHDTPDRALFDAADRRLSSGCVRLEDARRLSRWLFGRRVAASSPAPEQRVDLPDPVPIYINYFTAAPTEQGIAFRDDIYGRDEALLARLGERTEMASSE